ncbi:MAG TPA: DNA mismatch repair protein MutS [Aliiroseovarius sp.]|nr:DNA mismatch repair protein MutS [Aliiroseovarius sp.]
MSKKNDISEADRELFRESVADTRPLKYEPRVRPEKKRPPPRPLQKERDEQQVLADMLSDPVDPADMETGEELLFSRTGVQQRTLKKLRRGEFSIEAELDLHGQTKVEAREAIVEFLAFCHGHGLRCVRIIHGKGHGSLGKRPILKQYVNHWLRQRDDILAFCSARQVDGGTGAIYVLLRRKG